MTRGQLRLTQESVVVSIGHREWLGQQASRRFLAADAPVPVCVERVQEPFCGCGRVDLETASGMRVAGNCALPLRPSHYGRGPRGPALRLRALRAGKSLVIQVQQADVSERLGPESADL